jgi:hypothetical protein
MDLTNEEKDGGKVVRPAHYMKYDKEVADMMCDIWGPEAVAIWCKLNAYKYRMRMGYKLGVDPAEDFKKEQRCLEMYKKYKNMAKDTAATNDTVGPLYS